MKAQLIYTRLRLDSLKQDTSADPELSGLRDIIYSGWPDKQKQVPVHLRKYWAYRDELFVVNVTERIYQADQGFEKCRLRAKSCVFWPTINKDIEPRDEKYVKKVKIHKLGKHWNLMKYPQGLGRSLELICSSGKEMSICLYVIITPNFPSSGKSQVDSPQEKLSHQRHTVGTRST